MDRVASWGGALIVLFVGCASDARDERASGAQVAQAAGASAAGGSAGAGRGFAGGSAPPLMPILPSVDAGALIDTGTGVASVREPISIDQCGAGNPAGLSPADAQRLVAGGGGPGPIAWLYPYEATVFPRGMIAPLLMWDGAPGDAVFLHIRAMKFEYKGCLKPTAAGQLAIPQDVWDKAGQQSLGKPDPFTLELSVLSGNTVNGPAARTITIAQANIKGSIYYNSYSSRLTALGGGAPGGGGLPGLPGFPGGGPAPGGPGGGGLPVLPGAGGIVLRIPQGKQAEAFVTTGCNGCHSVSADGSRMLSQFVPGIGYSFALAMATGANPAGLVAGPRASFGALYPDGSKYLASSAEIDVARSFMTQGPGAPPAATLYDAASGMVVPSTGIPSGALMPMFSPDGSLLVFTDNAVARAHGLAIMKYDVKSNAATEHRVLMQTSGALRPGWPFVLPDNHGVVFVQTDGFDFSGNGAGVPLGGGIGGVTLPAGAAPTSDLFIADVATGMVTLLAQAMGHRTPQDAAANTTYLPFGAAELHHNYFPTVSPVAAGGYFWVFFDSIRHYGNLGEQRALWASAIEIRPDGMYVTDPSHPAFFVPGQELNTGNHRAFAALDPCKMEGDSCLSGIDCCGGFCHFPKDAPTEFGQPVGSCSPPPNTCAKTDERCLSDADCCPPEPGQPANSCIAGFCAAILLE